MPDIAAAELSTLRHYFADIFQPLPYFTPPRHAYFRFQLIFFQFHFDAAAAFTPFRHDFHFRDTPPIPPARKLFRLPAISSPFLASAEYLRVSWLLLLAVISSVARRDVAAAAPDGRCRCRQRRRQRVMPPLRAPRRCRHSPPRY